MSATPQSARVADSSLSTPVELRSVTTTTGVHRLGFIDGLRGLAAVYVVISHVWDTVFARRPPSERALRTLTAFMGFGRFAVALFIVVSGFSIGLGAWKGGLRWPGGTRTYIRRRVTRIWPPYAAAVVISSVLAATLLSKNVGAFYAQSNHIRPSGVLTHLALVQDIYWAGPAGSTAFWSIPVEFHIYFLFLPVLALIRLRLQSWQPVVAAFMLLTAASIAFPGNAVLGWFGGLSPSLYALFIVGFMAAPAAVAHAPFDVMKWRGSMIVMMILGCCLIVVCRSHYVPLSPLNDFLLGPAAAFLITQLVRGRYSRVQRMLSSRLVVWLGDCSYSIYLIHAVVVGIVWKFVVTPFTQNVFLRLVLELLLGVTASVVLARGFYRVFERPFLRSSPSLPRARASHPTGVPRRAQ